MYIYTYISGESNGNLPPRTCPGCIVPEPYRSHDWALVPAKPGLQGWILMNEYIYIYIYTHIHTSMYIYMCVLSSCWETCRCIRTELDDTRILSQLPVQNIKNSHCSAKDDIFRNCSHFTLHRSTLKLLYARISSNTNWATLHHCQIPTQVHYSPVLLWYKRQLWELETILKGKVKQSRYTPGVAHRVPGS